MQTPHRNWSAVAWERVEKAEVAPVADLEDAPDVRRVRVKGAEVLDQATGTCYRVTIGRGEGRVWVRTIEIDPLSGPVDPAALRRVPLTSLATYVALFLDQREAEDLARGAGGGKPSGSSLAFGAAGRGTLRPDALERGTVPEPAEVARLLNEGHTRRTLAQLYVRSPSTISDWIGRAYREVPKMMPARRPGGRRPAPKTPDGKKSPEN